VMKSSGDKESICFKTFFSGNISYSIFLPGLCYRFHLDKFVDVHAGVGKLKVDIYYSSTLKSLRKHVNIISHFRSINTDFLHGVACLP